MRQIIFASMTLVLLFSLVVETADAKMIIIEGDGYDFPVVEKDQTKIIANKTRQYLDNTNIEDDGSINLKKPPAVSTKESIRRVDATYTFPYDIADKDGKILRSQGETFNPLTEVSIPDLIVVDGSSEAQLLWARQYREENLDPTSMIVLSGGNWIAARGKGVAAYRLSEKLQHRLQITHVPCLITQDGEDVVIHEFNAEDLD